MGSNGEPCTSPETEESRAPLWTWKGLLSAQRPLEETGNSKYRGFSLAELILGKEESFLPPPTDVLE